MLTSLQMKPSLTDLSFIKELEKYMYDLPAIFRRTMVLPIYVTQYLIVQYKIGIK